MANSFAVKESQQKRRERRANERDSRRRLVAFGLFCADNQEAAEEYLSRADRAIAVERARAKGEI
jgi:hypothetical protein